MTAIPNTILTAYDADHLHSLVDSNEHAHSLTVTECDRLYSVSSQRDTSMIITTDWATLARENLGSRNNKPNYYGLCDINWDVSEHKGAWLCENATAVTRDWLATGDGRKRTLQNVDVTDTEYVDEKGVLWWPKEYTFVFTVA